MGVEHLKAPILFLVHFASSVDLAKQDGKFDLSDIALFLGLLKDVPGAIQGLRSGALEEWKSLPDEGRDEIYAAIEELDLVSDSVEKIVETALKVLVQLGALVAEFEAKVA